jgi:hypothetical protein
MKPNPVGWFEIYVQDMKRARDFYETVFQVTLQELPAPQGPDGDNSFGQMEMWVFPMSDTDYGSPGALIRMDPLPSGPGGTMVYFTCQDCAVEAALASENGGSVFRPKTSIGEYGFIALVNDTEGNMIGLHSRQ